jgi:hypothetical protein
MYDWMLAESIRTAKNCLGSFCTSLSCSDIEPSILGFYHDELQCFFTVAAEMWLSDHSITTAEDFPGSWSIEPWQ